MKRSVLYDFDVIVIGGGAGGATFAYACAKSGKSVLVLERGDRPVSGALSFDERAIVELVWLCSFTLYLTRMARALGIASDGFCKIGA